MYFKRARAHNKINRFWNVKNDIRSVYKYLTREFAEMRIITANCCYFTAAQNSASLPLTARWYFTISKLDLTLNPGHFRRIANI